MGLEYDKKENNLFLIIFAFGCHLHRNIFYFTDQILLLMHIVKKKKLLGISKRYRYQKQIIMNNIEKDTFQYVVDKFADIEVLRYKVDGFENLTLKTKTIHLLLIGKATQEGRDILFDKITNTIYV